MRLAIFFVAQLMWGQPVTLAGFSDQGAFLLYANEDRIGRLAFQWKPDGAFTGTTTLSLGGQSTEQSVTITPDAQGRWVRAVADKSVWERTGDSYKLTSPELSFEGGRVPKEALTFETWTPPLMSLALRRFDRAGEKRQTLPVLVLNLEIVGDANLNVERGETAERFIHGQHLKLTRWIYAPPAHEYHVLADENGRVYLASGFTGLTGGIAEQNTVFVREGYEELIEKPRDDGSVSQLKYVVETRPGTAVPMRDGVKLSTDLYLPSGAGKSPVILIRTPYKKELEELQGWYYARRGYAVAIQDARGRFASPGVWEPFVHEAKDGYDTIEWLARQPWSSGKVGTIGGSYEGWVQWAAAGLHPPHLAAMIPNVSPPDPFHNMPFEHGSLWLMASLTWGLRVESNATGDLSGAIEEANSRKDIPALAKALPVIDLDKSVLGKETGWWRQWMAHTTPDDYWKEAMFRAGEIDVPVFHQSGWFDGDGIGSKLNYLGAAAGGHADQKLTIGPWEHTDTAVRLSQKRDFGPEAAVDLQREFLRWFDYWLKGRDNGIMREPRVSLFVMGSNRWLRGPVYPLPQTRFEKLYLERGGGLGFGAPGDGEAPDRYVYDPGEPTPGDRMAGEDRKDVVAYTTAPFDKPVTIAGPLSAVLYAASSARDTDWFVQLMEVDENGKRSVLWNGGVGGIRARYRDSPTKASLLTPGKIYEYRIDLWHTAVTLAPGHRLRVEVSSAAFPWFDRNLNTGGNNETETRFVSAEQAIYHDAGHASYVLLPVIPE